MISILRKIIELVSFSNLYTEITPTRQDITYFYQMYIKYNINIFTWKECLFNDPERGILSGSIMAKC